MCGVIELEVHGKEEGNIKKEIDKLTSGKPVHSAFPFKVLIFSSPISSLHLLLLNYC